MDEGHAGALRQEASGFAEEMGDKHGNKPLFLQCDITDIPTLKAAIDQVATAHGPIRVLVNNAANDQRHTTGEVDESFWDRAPAINLKAYFFACQAVIEGLRREERKKLSSDGRDKTALVLHAGA